MRGGHLAGQAAGCGRLQEAGTDSDRFNLSSSKNQPLSPATETLRRFPGIFAGKLPKSQQVVRETPG
ncbi:hypothetical protein pipiens_018372 [Culex pipiens pipiens]|uniref:Uncharacterized protein n=1 Tax=Culex pipiens pipiens TaxID=38569 RepID=A0ABD1CC46_CULPP